MAAQHSVKRMGLQVSRVLTAKILAAVILVGLIIGFVEPILVSSIPNARILVPHPLLAWVVSTSFFFWLLRHEAAGSLSFGAILWALLKAVFWPIAIPLQLLLSNGLKRGSREILAFLLVVVSFTGSQLIGLAVGLALSKSA